MTDSGLIERSFDFAKTIADELERPDQLYLEVRNYGSGAHVLVLRPARAMIERYVRRALEADRKARCPAGE